MTDFKEQCICIKIGKIVAETFQRGNSETDYYFIVLQSPDMEWHLSRMLNIQGACLPAEGTEMWNIFTGFGMKVDVLLSTSWLMS